MRFTPITHPFTPTERLQEHCRQYLYEYATFGREVLPWPESVIGWQMTDDEGNEAGFLWLQPDKEGAANVRFRMMAVYDEYARRGFADAAHRFVESQLPRLGIDTLRVQVNTNRPRGRRVRAWLLKKGFRVIRREEHAEFAHLPEDVYAANCTKPLKFEKNYEHGEAREAEDFHQEDFPPFIGTALLAEFRRDERWQAEVAAEREGVCVSKA